LEDPKAQKGIWPVHVAMPNANKKTSLMHPKASQNF